MEMGSGDTNLDFMMPWTLIKLENGFNFACLLNMMSLSTIDHLKKVLKGIDASGALSKALSMLIKHKKTVFIISMASVVMDLHMLRFMVK